MSPISTCSWREVFDQRPPKIITSSLIAFSLLGMTCLFQGISGRMISFLFLHKQHFKTWEGQFPWCALPLPNHSDFLSGFQTHSIHPHHLIGSTHCLKCCSSQILFSLGLSSSDISLERLFFAFQSTQPLGNSVPFSLFYQILFCFLSLLIYLPHQECRFSEILVCLIHYFILTLPRTHISTY